jgi:hypothetical protein
LTTGFAAEKETSATTQPAVDLVTDSSVPDGGTILLGGATIADSDAGVRASSAATTRPAATVPATQPAESDLNRNSVDSTLDRMLRTRPGSVRPLQPASGNSGQAATSVTKLENDSVDLLLKREGDIMTDRVGRLQNSGAGWEFHFESDGRALKDPPMALLPNSVLAQMEAAGERSGRDLRFRVTGMITTYHGRNYLLVEKARAVSKADED